MYAVYPMNTLGIYDVFILVKMIREDKTKKTFRFESIPSNADNSLLPLVLQFVSRESR